MSSVASSAAEGGSPRSVAAAGARGITPVILSGGAGTRLWPLSRRSFPKQLWSLVSEHSLLQDAALRVVGPEFTAPLVVCNEAHRFLIAEQMRTAGITGRILLEPEGRNTAPAIAAAALLAVAEDPRAILWMVAADAAIGDPAALRRALDTALPAARAGWIVTFGMPAERPETGYGWIEAGAPIADAPGARVITRFIEKPDQETAARLLASSRYSWNSGMFLFEAGVLLEGLAKHAPAVLEEVRRAYQARREERDFVWLGAAAFRAAPAISLDYALAERSDRAAVVAADLGWSDVGNWDALWQISSKDAAGNVALGDTVLEGARDCYVRSEGCVTAVVGLENAVVVVTPDAVLALAREHAQDVKKVVERLAAGGRKEATTHRRIFRPWGSYESLWQGDRFQVKRIVVTPGGVLSLQKHFHRAEHWVVVEGSALVTVGEEKRLLKENDDIYIPLGAVHRLENPGRIPMTLIEVQLGSYLGEDDIVRLEDVYGRA